MNITPTITPNPRVTGAIFVRVNSSTIPVAAAIITADAPVVNRFSRSEFTSIFF